MKRPALWLGLGVIVAAVALAWLLGTRRSAPPASAPAPIAQDEPGAGASAQPSRLPPPPHLTLESAPGDLGRAGTPAPADIAQQLTLARQSVIRAARSCGRVTSRLDGTQSLRVRQRLVVKDGEGRVSEATILDGTLADATARACVLGAFRSARWRTEGADRELMFEMEVTLDELTR
jgi:hypothetical protein